MATVQLGKPASTMSLQERIAELHQIRTRYANDPLIVESYNMAIKALGVVS